MGAPAELDKEQQSGYKAEQKHKAERKQLVKTESECEFPLWDSFEFEKQSNQDNAWQNHQK